MIEAHEEIEHGRQQWNTMLYVGGSAAARKRLCSAGLAVTKIEMYRGQRGNIWQATTDKGKRWVSWDPERGWIISKEPPAARRRRA